MVPRAFQDARESCPCGQGILFVFKARTFLSGFWMHFSLWAVQNSKETSSLEGHVAVPETGQHPMIRAEARGTSTILGLMSDDK